MKKLIGPIFWLVVVVVSWFYFQPDWLPIPAEVPPGAVQNGHDAGQAAVDQGQHFYDGKYFWPTVVCGGAAFLGIMFWKNLGQKAKIIVVAFAAVTLTVMALGGKH